MLTKIQNPKIGYVSRIMVLPLAALVFAAFALKPKTASFSAPVGALERTITVMIDPGHGGTDDGALAPDGTKEKDINLSIAKKIQKLNPYKNIIIMLSRDDDKTIGVRDRVEFAKKSNIDAYISIHANTNGPSDTRPSGIELYVSRKPQTYAAYTRLLASLVAGELSKNYRTDQVLKKNESSGVCVLDTPDMNYA
jgi:N-acetylmuramoyl-L-alanine amidase